MTLPAHRFRDREERANTDDARTWVCDFDGTITGAPEQMARIATGLKALGDRIIVLTGNKGPRADLVKQLSDFGFPYDDLVQYHDDGTNGIGRAHYLEQFGAWCAFDNRIDRAPIFANVCPHLYVIAAPLDDSAHGTKKAAKKAAKQLRSVDQDNDAYREGVADHLAGRPMLTAAEFAASHPDADADDYPFYVAGYESDRDDLKLVPEGQRSGPRFDEGARSKLRLVGDE